MVARFEIEYECERTLRMACNISRDIFDWEEKTAVKLVANRLKQKQVQ